MGDMGHIFNDMRADRRRRAEDNVQARLPFIEQLKREASAIRVLPGGWRFVFVAYDESLHEFDYWPQRDKWCEHRWGKQYHRQGKRELIARLSALGIGPAGREPLDAGLRRILARRIVA